MSDTDSAGEVATALRVGNSVVGVSREAAETASPAVSTESRYPLPTGRLSLRLHGARMELIERAASALASAAMAQVEGQIEFAASLRGKARGYSEAAEVILALERQRRFPKRWLHKRRRSA